MVLCRENKHGLERKFQFERPYAFRHGIKRKGGLSLCQEIIIAKIMIQNLTDYCLENPKQPFKEGLLKSNVTKRLQQ